jgi:tRNA nucleotidyltransferase (CCA-adding enzyme)
VLYAIDAFRRPERFAQFLQACEADARGRTGYQDKQPEQTALLTACLDAANAVETTSLAEGKEGAAIKAAIDEARLSAIEGLGLRGS